MNKEYISLRDTTNPSALTLPRLFLLILWQYHLLKSRSTSLLLRFARNRYPSVYNTRNCQRNVRNDFVSRSKRDLKIDRKLSLPRNQGAFLNLPPAGTATRTLAAGTRYFVTWDSAKRLDLELPRSPHNRQPPPSLLEYPELRQNRQLRQPLEYPELRQQLRQYRQLH
ncbi:hypothetical protein NA56DRAFT_415177 [Hyaloscypha hepaticicola]|uniref:Uncharacterized protein n=1 Tax=Hyaloscypha hepaticicola TaxID=2082293 RepID=A0A2J6PI87_9HELO|nr:hypothetical protein NA56DRAFT_415177 [Hyaloscypha hepaticicola]